jgi:hypothetical protein
MKIILTILILFISFSAYSSHYQEVIDYMVSSPSIDPNTQYTCGDEDLELLLK